MKKFNFIVAIATLGFLSCQQDQDSVINNEVKKESYTFKASIENFATRANINNSYELVWASGDKIGIYVNDASWNDKNQPFTLSSGEGTTQGDFTWDYSGSFSDNAAAAFYPWQGTGSNNNNVFEGTMYFKLPESYSDYTSGKMLTPLIASLSGSTDEIHFKHVGAAVKVTINNLPAGAHSIGMSVNGQQITGSYRINPANAGTDALSLDGTSDISKNSVWLNYTNNSESEWTFIFPVPTLTEPKLSFQIYDKNDVLVWSKTTPKQPTLVRADILEMPALSITPYSQFSKSTEWTFCGNIDGAAWIDDIPMCTDGTVCILRGVTFKANDEFKIRKNKNWGEAYPSSNYVVTSDCTKDVWFNISTKEITLKDAGCPYPTYSKD